MNGGASIFLGEGGARFTTPRKLEVSEPTSMAVGDVDGDNATDLAITTSRKPLLVYLGDGSGRKFMLSLENSDSVSREKRSSAIPLSRATGIVIGDLNNDMRPDIAYTSNTGDSEIHILLNGYSKEVLSARSVLSRISVADMDGDGDQDLIVADVESNNIIILTNTCVP